MQAVLFEELELVTPGQRLLTAYENAMASTSKLEAEFTLQGLTGKKLNKAVKQARSEKVNKEPELTGEELNEYDHILVGFSGGKDSQALVLQLLELGVDKSKIELHHHDIDGEDNGSFMDYKVTKSYCQAFADAFGLPIFYSYKEGGFEREMLRQDSLTAPVKFEVPLVNGKIETRQSGGTAGKPNTRLKFPQVSADLSVRWCSAYLKIMVCSAMISNQERFHNKSVLLLTGERAEESAARSMYFKFEPHNTNATSRLNRVVHQYRMVHTWSTEQVWEIIQKYGVNAHPAYHLGLGRCSCMGCIFGNRDQWKMIQEIDNERFEKIAQYEERFGLTIKRDESVREQASKGEFKRDDVGSEAIRLALSEDYDASVILPASEWKMPIGAFAEGCGPT